MKTVKKNHIFAFSILSLLMVSLVGTAAAWNVDYNHTNYYSQDYAPTIDGTYIMDDEWLASGTAYFGTDGIFRDEWTMVGGVLACLLIETSDATDDATDKWIICYDGTETGGQTEPDGGANPTEYDTKVEITGHGASETIEWFTGDGSGWVSASPQPTGNAAASLYNLTQALTTTPKIVADHWVLEMAIDKTSVELGYGIMGYNWTQFVSYYDATADTTQQWPDADATTPGDPDVPDTWGYIGYQFAANPVPDLPDGISIIALVVVSSAAATGAVVFRKRTK
jgi:hypothetical protein